MPDGPFFARQRACDVPIQHIPAIWPKIEHFVRSGLAIDPARRYEPVDIYQLLLAGRGRLWVSWDYQAKEFEAAGVTEIIQYPRCRECRVWFLAGRNMKIWEPELREMVEAYARFEGCDHLATTGRRGWVRTSGFEQAGFELIKRLG